VRRSDGGGDGGEASEGEERGKGDGADHRGSPASVVTASGSVASMAGQRRAGAEVLRSLDVTPITAGRNLP
jgi:hypothetical protein